MAPTGKFGNTEAGAVYVLPDLPFDLLEGEPLPEKLGKTDVPVCILADLAFDLQTFRRKL